MEDAGMIDMKGAIVIELQRKHMNAVLRVCDNAEGMTPEDMDKKGLRKYGEATSGFKEGQICSWALGQRFERFIFRAWGMDSVSSIRDGTF